MSFCVKKHNSSREMNMINWNLKPFSSINDDCCYYADEQYNQNIKSKGEVTIIHLNSRGL